MVVGRVAGRPLKRLPGTEHAREQAPVGHVVIADDNEPGIRHASDPVPRGLELGGQAALRDISGDQDKVMRGGVGVVEGRRTGMAMLAAEMDIGELKDTSH